MKQFTVAISKLSGLKDFSLRALLRNTAVFVAVAAFSGAVPGENLVGENMEIEITGFVLRITDHDGQLAYIVEGERMVQTETVGGNIQQRAERPHLQILDAGILDWVWQSQAAVHDPLQHRWFLDGATTGLRPARDPYPHTEIITRDVTILSEAQQIMTSERSTLVQPGLFMTGIGLHADINTSIIRLLSNVHTVYAQEEEEDILQ